MHHAVQAGQADRVFALHAHTRYPCKQRGVVASSSVSPDGVFSLFDHVLPRLRFSSWFRSSASQQKRLQNPERVFKRIPETNDLIQNRSAALFTKEDLRFPYAGAWPARDRFAHHVTPLATRLTPYRSSSMPIYDLT